MVSSYKVTAAHPGHYVLHFNSKKPDGAPAREAITAWVVEANGTWTQAFPVTLDRKPMESERRAVLFPDGRVVVGNRRLYTSEAEWLVDVRGKQNADPV